MFENVVAIAVQNAFRLEMHQNNVFYFLKIIFNINALKRSKNKKKLILSKNKNSIFRGTRLEPHSQGG